MSEKIPRVELAQMADADLLDLRSELSKELGRLTQQMQKTKANHARVKNELNLRAQGGREVGLPIVSDHAVIRYLERHKGVDIMAVRQELRELARRAKYERDENKAKNAERLKDQETGLTLIYSPERNSIATVLSPTAESVLDGNSTLANPAPSLTPGAGK